MAGVKTANVIGITERIIWPDGQPRYITTLNGKETISKTLLENQILTVRKKAVKNTCQKD